MVIDRALRQFACTVEVEERRRAVTNLGHEFVSPCERVSGVKCRIGPRQTEEVDLVRQVRSRKCLGNVADRSQSEQPMIAGGLSELRRDHPAGNGPSRADAPPAKNIGRVVNAEVNAADADQHGQKHRQRHEVEAYHE